MFDFLLRGFLPFIPSRPWVVEQLAREISLPDKEINIVAFSSGRSGFFHALGRKYPKAKMLGVESETFPFAVAWFQALIRSTSIKIVKQPIHRVDVSQADFIYIHLNPGQMQGLGKKLKFECRPDTVIISTGFNVPPLIPKKVIDLPDRRGRLDWLSKNQKLFTRKSKQFKKEKKAYLFFI